MNEKVFTDILIYFSTSQKKDLVPLICKRLNIQYYKEGSTTSLSSADFVIDIIAPDSISIVFVDSTLNSKYKYICEYLSTALSRKDYLYFYYFLRYFINSFNIDNTPKKIKCTHRIEKYFDVLYCKCVESGVCTEGSNIFTHGGVYKVDKRDRPELTLLLKKGIPRKEAVEFFN